MAATPADDAATPDPATAAAETAIQDAAQPAGGTASDAAQATASGADDQAAPTVVAATLVPLGQLAPGGGPSTATGAPPAKSAKATQIQTAVGAAAKSLADAAAPASELIKAGASAPAGDMSADPTDPQTDALLALPHDQGQTSADAQSPMTAAANSSSQVPQPTTLTAPLAAATAAPAAAMASSHGADITAQLAAQITSRAGAPRAAFDFALEPQGLGRVDVTLKFESQGQLSAVLSFDNPSAAAEAKSRAGDLQQALQQAGFDVGQSGLSFTSGGQGQGAAWQAPSQATYATAPVLMDPVAEAVSSNSRLRRLQRRRPRHHHLRTRP